PPPPPPPPPPPSFFFFDMSSYEMMPCLVGSEMCLRYRFLGHQTSHETMKFIGVPKKEMDTTIALNL
ncbi:hypothetical protein NVR12_09525, partial [Staphylococcus pseudintermedius]|nr:hypothetical protein [Staphylococcus pseudintermedius]